MSGRVFLRACECGLKKSFEPKAEAKRSQRLRAGHRRSKSEGQKGISIGFVKHGCRPFLSSARHATRGNCPERLHLSAERPRAVSPSVGWDNLSEHGVNFQRRMKESGQ